MIHRALLGSIERFFGILIEHYAGKFPVWLAPVQLRLMFLVKECDAFKQEVVDACKAHGVRFDIDETNEKLGYKVRKAQLEKVPLVGIIGEKELQEKNITIRYRDTKNQSIYTIQELIKEIVSRDTNNTQEV